MISWKTLRRNTMTVTLFGLDRQATLTKLSQGKGNVKITLFFQEKR